MHVIFDIANMLLPPSQLSLQKVGHTSNNADHCAPPDSSTITTPSADISDDSCLQVQLLSPNATLPHQATSMDTGYDLCSTITCHLPLNEITKVPTDLDIQPPTGTYAQLVSMQITIEMSRFYSTMHLLLFSTSIKVIALLRCS